MDNKRARKMRNYYPENIHLATVATDEHYSKNIMYYDPVHGKYLQRRCIKDHHADRRRQDAQLLRAMAWDYYLLVRNARMVHMGQPQAESLQLLRESANALDGRGTVADMFKQLAPGSSHLINMAAACITACLEYIGYDNVLEPQQGTKQLCQQLTYIARLAEQRYETAVYNN